MNGRRCAWMSRLLLLLALAAGGARADCPDVVDSTSITSFHIDDFTEHSYLVGTTKVGDFHDCTVTRIFAHPIQSLTVTIVAGDADDVGYVGSILVTNVPGGCSGVGGVGSPVDVTSQVSVSGSQASLVLSVQDLCPPFAGWGDTPGRQPAKLHWQVTLAGTPVAHLGPTSLHFGSQVVGTTSSPQSVVLSNSGTGLLTLNSIGLSGPDAGSFKSTGGDNSGSLDMKSSQTIRVVFSPTKVGPQNASLVINDNATGSPQQVSLTGTGIVAAPAASVSPNRLDFGTLLLGQSATRSVTVSNTGSAPLTIGALGLSGDHDFSVSGGGGGPLPPGSSRSLNVTFSPAAVGPRSGTLSIPHNAPGSPATVILVGTGANPPPPGTPVASVFPGQLDFGSQPVGTESDVQPVTVADLGTAQLVISDIRVTGANASDFRVVSGTLGTVSEGTTRTISLRFTPSALGQRAATLLVSHNADGSPAAVTLVGAGTPPTPPAPGAAPVITGYAATQPRGVPIFSAPPTYPVLVLGKNLGTGGTLSFNGLPALPPTSWTPSEILAIVPAAPIYPFVGPVSVTVSGQSATGPPFTITLPPPPAAASTDWPVFMHDPRQLGLAGQALDPRTLSPWSFALGSRPAGQPVIRGGATYIGTEAGDVLAIDTATHALRWRRHLPAPVRAAAAAGDQAVVVSAGGLFGLSPLDGSLLWQRTDLVPEDSQAPMLVDSTVYVGARSSEATAASVHALSAATGLDLWPSTVAMPSGLTTRAAVAASPEQGLLLLGLGPSTAADGPGTLLALRDADGQALWSNPILLPAGHAPTGLSLGWAQAPLGATPGLQPALFVAAGNMVVARNAVTGAGLWSRTLPETELIGAPLLAAAAEQGTTLLVAGASGQLYELDSSSGALTGGTRGAAAVPGDTPQPPAGTPALAGSYLYLPLPDRLTALDMTSGQTLWSSPLAAATGVSVAAGHPYLGTADGLLVGFDVASAPSVVVHDVAIVSLQVPERVSRSADATVSVTLTNRGTQSEACELRLRVQPGQVVLDQAETLAAGETQTVALTWPTYLMGDDGPKTLVAELSLTGAADSHPADNQAIQVVVVGP